MKTVTILFARHDSIYKTLPGCDVYDKERNALNWSGGSPIIAHPPCRAWGRLRQFAKPDYGEKELAIWAIMQVRKYGGVVEHPEGSSLWPFLNLPKVGEKEDIFSGYTMKVSQFNWGHRAEKRTLLYIVGIDKNKLPAIPKRPEYQPTHVMSTSRKKSGNRPEITVSEREATPLKFALWLCELARKTMV
ncbi:MAG: hypothetical protein ACE5I1_07685 [bacterium]